MMWEKDSFMDMFICETNDLIRQMEQIMMDSEGPGCFVSQDSIHAVFRIMHTIKGSASMMDLPGIAELAHAMEELFEFVRTNTDAAGDPRVMDAARESLDWIKKEMDRLSAGEAANADASYMIQKTQNLLIMLERGGDSADEEAEQENAAYTKGSSSADGQEQKAAAASHAKVRKAANASKRESIRESNSREEQASKGRSESVSADEQETAASRDTQPPSKAPASQPPAAEPVKETMISVSAEKLDLLMDLVGELVVSGMMITQELLADIRKADYCEYEEILDAREALCRQHEKIIGDLRDMAAFLRVLPMSVIFHRMRRMIRDMCRKLDIRVNVRVIGEETQIDKNVLDSISDPLMHLVRNAVGHGVGAAGERLAAGKPEEGTITLEARNVGGDVWILVSDDGKGIDLTRIYQKAYANGWTVKPQADMTDEEILSYIFKPGMTTSPCMTEFFGRGVGLDVVNRNVSGIGGRILVETVKGEGSTFTLKVPASFAIISGMAFSAGGNTYALPSSSIQECVEAEDQELMLDPDGNEAILIREECYPILRLHRLFQLKTQAIRISEGVLIVVDTKHSKYCLFVDRLIGEQQLVVKPLPRWVENRVKGVSGCTPLKDGRITLILEAALLTG